MNQESIVRRLRRLFDDPKYQPTNKSELGRRLRIPAKGRAAFHSALSTLVEDGTVYYGKRGRLTRPSGHSRQPDSRARAANKAQPPSAAGNGKHAPERGKSGSAAKSSRTKTSPAKNSRVSRESSKSAKSFSKSKDLRAGLTLDGTYQVGFRGQTEVILDDRPEDENPVRIFARDTHTALPGDRVAIRLEEDNPPAWMEKKGRRSRNAGGFRGKVVKVLERSPRPILGTYHRSGKFQYMKPEGSALPPTVDLEKGPPRRKKGQQSGFEPEDGDKVLVRIDRWTNRNDVPQGTVVDVLGAADAPGIDILSLVHRHGLPVNFPEKVVAEAQKIPRKISDEEIAKRVDWRDRLVITIDPATAKDFDDAISVVPLRDGGWELGVHIADVSTYVKPGTLLDKEAFKRGNSTYLADRVLPMLPEVLSNGLCSLVPEEDRLTRCAVMTFDAKGNRRSARFEKAIIRSARRYTYEEAFELLEDPEARNASDPTVSLLHEAWDLGQRLRQNRFRAGALDMDFPEVRAVLDEKTGRAIGISQTDNDISHQLIEEFMLAANEAVASELRKRETTGIYRVHEDPDDDKLLELREFLQAHGIKVGNLALKTELQKALKAADGRPEEQAIKVAILRSMKRADYRSDPLGHYGLSKKDYTHFTSPIRRYADLVVHRVLYKESGEKTPGYAPMQEIAKHLSSTERVSSDAESESQRMKQMEFFLTILEKNPDEVFAGKIIEVRRMGIFVELDETLFRGLIPGHSLGSEWRPFDPGRREFLGRTQSGKPLRLAAGVPVEVRVAKVDAELYRLDFELAAVDSTEVSRKEPRSRYSQDSRRSQSHDSRRGKSSGKSSKSRKSSSTKGRGPSKSRRSSGPRRNSRRGRR